MMENRLKDILPPILMALFGLVLILFIIPNQISVQSSSSLINSRSYPYALGVLIVLFSIVSVIQDLRQSSNAAKQDSAEDKEAQPGQKRYLVIAGMYIAMIVWALFLKMIGFVIGTFLLTAVLMLLLGNRNLYQLILVPVIFTAFLYYLAIVVLKINLPTGMMF